MERRYFDIASAVNALVSHDDQNAFEYIFNTFYNKLLRVAVFYMGRESLAKDIVADVFYKLWSGRSKLAKVENLNSYLLTMTKNQCLYVIRSNKKVIYSEEMMEFNEQVVIENPESKLISEEFIKYYNFKIQDLPPRCKLIYLMVKDDGLRYKEVADILNISIKTVENQMTKAMAHIRNCLNSYKRQESAATDKKNNI